MYKKFLACDTRLARTKLVAQLTQDYQCHPGTIYRALSIEHGGPLSKAPLSTTSSRPQSTKPVRVVCTLLIFIDHVYGSNLTFDHFDIVSAL